MHHNSQSTQHLLWMLLGCGLLILLLVVFGNRLSNSWITVLILGACVIPHVLMMRNHRHDQHTDKEKPDTEDTHKHHKGGCCHSP